MNSVTVTQYHWVSNPQPLYHPTTGGTTALPVCCLLDCNSEIFLYIEATDSRSNFAKTILFENCSCFSKIPFIVSPWNFPGYFSVSFRFPQVTDFGKSTAIYLPDFIFVSFTHPSDQQDRKIRTIRKSAARWHGRRARGCWKLILRANLQYVPNIKM